MLRSFYKRNLDANRIFFRVVPYTMISRQRMKVVINAIEHIYRGRVSGALVECGVWKGGCVMAMMERLRELAMYRHIWAYDTFGKGMTGASKIDINNKGHKGEFLNGKLATSREEFEKNITQIDYGRDWIHIIEGDVRETIPLNAPKKIAILRLDVDFYEATKWILEHLYPIVSDNGVVIFDDYACWQGCKKAVDEHFDSLEKKPAFVSSDHHYLVK